MTMKIVTKKTGTLMIGTALVAFPASFCVLFGWPMVLVAVMVAQDLEPTGEWDTLTVVANVLNFVFMGGASVCMAVAPMPAMAGAVIYVLADQQAKSGS